MRVDPAGIIVRKGQFTTLTQQQFAVFEILRKAAGRSVSKEKLLAELYPIDADEAQVKIIDVFVCHLRRKLKPLGLAITTDWGRGYRFALPSKEPTA